MDRFKQVAWTTFTKTLPGMSLVGKLAAAAFVTLGTALWAEAGLKYRQETDALLADICAELCHVEIRWHCS